MVWQIKNLPDVKSDVGIECTREEDGRFRVHTSDGWEICTIGTTTPEQTASDIADAIRLARNEGFEQGRAHIRRALGGSI